MCVLFSKELQENKVENETNSANVNHYSAKEERKCGDLVKV
jgi:hypothetical protein